MSYAESRDAGQFDLLRIATLQLVERWHARPPGSKRRTLFLFPGGLGSKLFRATAPYVAAGPAIQKFSNDQIWLTPCSLLGDALLAEMHWSADEGIYRDLDDRIVIADGSVALLGADPYVGFTDWCDARF